MLDVMAGGMAVTWRELDEEWPWSRVLRAHEAVQRRRFYDAHPVAYLHSSYIAAHLKKGHRPPRVLDLIHPAALPLSIREAEKRAEPVFSAEVVAAFTLARSLGLTGNAHLAAFGVDELRASGWGREEA